MQWGLKGAETAVAEADHLEGDSGLVRIAWVRCAKRSLSYPEFWPRIKHRITNISEKNTRINRPPPIHRLHRLRFRFLPMVFRSLGWSVYDFELIGDFAETEMA